MAHVRSNLDEIVAGMPAVQARVEAVAKRTEDQIKKVLSKHIRTGRLFDSVNTERSFKRKDWWVNIDAKYASWANYGHESTWTARRVEGINFIKAAVYSASKGR